METRWAVTLQLSGDEAACRVQLAVQAAKHMLNSTVISRALAAHVISQPAPREPAAAGHPAAVMHRRCRAVLSYAMPRCAQPAHCFSFKYRLDRMVCCGFPDEVDRLAILQAVGRKLCHAMPCYAWFSCVTVLCCTVLYFTAWWLPCIVLSAGRLDRMVYCGFPDEVDRLAILQAVGRKLAPGADISLQDIARVTQGFTGADLAAILSEAQLLAVHDQIDTHGSGGKQDPLQQQQEQGVEHQQGQVQQQPGEGEASPSAAACVLTAQHIQRALARARPSLPVTEKRRLEAVYARFQQSRDPGLSNRPAVVDEDHTRVKHATLA